MQHNETKVRLSIEEYDLVNNAQILLTKNGILKKVNEMFGHIAAIYQQQVDGVLQQEVLKKLPKISRGENYQGLPYLMLDFPRHFLKSDTIAIRSFFWWGNFFSITLQLSGIHYIDLLPRLLLAAEQNLLREWHVGINENEWHHHFGETNYRLMNKEEIIAFLKSSDKVKLSKKIPLSEWDNAINFFESNYKVLLNIIS